MWMCAAVAFPAQNSEKHNTEFSFDSRYSRSHSPFHAIRIQRDIHTVAMIVAQRSMQGRLPQRTDRQGFLELPLESQQKRA